MSGGRLPTSVTFVYVDYPSTNGGCTYSSSIVDQVVKVLVHHILPPLIVYRPSARRLDIVYSPALSRFLRNPT